MKVTRGYKTELDPTLEQYILFCRCAGTSRYAFNYGLARKDEAYKNRERTPTAIDLQKELTARKHDDLTWLGMSASGLSRMPYVTLIRHLIISSASATSRN